VLAKIRQVLPELDVPPRSLMISVEQLGNGEANERSTSAGVAVVQPPVSETRSASRVERHTTRTVVTGSLSQASASATSGDVQQLRALEGHPALIRAGKAVPQAVVGAAGAAATSPGYVEADTGFYVVLRVVGDVVTLEILATGDRVDDAGRLSVQRV
jgi:hypothetical protein